MAARVAMITLRPVVQNYFTKRACQVDVPKVVGLSATGWFEKLTAELSASMPVAYKNLPPMGSEI